jgi:hypothetical protein
MGGHPRQSAKSGVAGGSRRLVAPPRRPIRLDSMGERLSVGGNGVSDQRVTIRSIDLSPQAYTYARECECALAEADRA